jgi:hypothetical protein
MLSTHEGWTKLKSQIVDTHAAYNFPLWSPLNRFEYTHSFHFWS